MKSFRLSDRNNRLSFALELYNISSDLQKDRENEDTSGKIAKLASSLEGTNIPSFTGKANLKRPNPPNDDGKTQPKPQTRRRGGSGDQLEACEDGEVVEDVFEMDGSSDASTQELLFKDSKVYYKNHQRFFIHDVALTIIF
jgi:hypothetical protein